MQAVLTLALMFNPELSMLAVLPNLEVCSVQHGRTWQHEEWLESRKEAWPPLTDEVDALLALTKQYREEWELLWLAQMDGQDAALRRRKLGELRLLMGEARWSQRAFCYFPERSLPCPSAP